MDEIFPQNEREVVEHSTNTDSILNQRSGGVRKWFREAMEKLGIFPPKKGDITEHIRIGRPLELEELFSSDREIYDAAEDMFWKWLTRETLQQYKNQWVIFTGDGLAASAMSKYAAREKAKNQGLKSGDYTIRLVRSDLLGDTK